ncbi:MAG: FAD binding domain-containing protein, partial [Chitinophaga sp.]|uniref:FAD binding domain-containing protein n=1 Tax=Chitinophaga sp. TaxID=1869181 RepID=UPI001B192EE9
MNPFTYARAAGASDAVQQGAVDSAKYLGGGTNLIDLMRETIERPSSLVDVTGFSREIEALPGGGLLIGAGVRNTALAEHSRVRQGYP